MSASLKFSSYPHAPTSSSITATTTSTAATTALTTTAAPTAMISTTATAVPAAMLQDLALSSSLARPPDGEYADASEQPLFKGSAAADDFTQEAGTDCVDITDSASSGGSAARVNNAASVNSAARLNHAAGTVPAKNSGVLVQHVACTNLEDTTASSGATLAGKGNTTSGQEAVSIPYAASLSLCTPANEALASTRRSSSRSPRKKGGGDSNSAASNKIARVARSKTARVARSKTARATRSKTASAACTQVAAIAMKSARVVRAQTNNASRGQASPELAGVEQISPDLAGAEQLSFDLAVGGVLSPDLAIAGTMSPPLAVAGAIVETYEASRLVSGQEIAAPAALIPLAPMLVMPPYATAAVDLAALQRAGGLLDADKTAGSNDQSDGEQDACNDAVSSEDEATGGSKLSRGTKRSSTGSINQERGKSSARTAQGRCSNLTQGAVSKDGTDYCENSLDRESSLSREGGLEDRSNSACQVGLAREANLAHDLAYESWESTVAYLAKVHALPSLCSQNLPAPQYPLAFQHLIPLANPRYIFAPEVSSEVLDYLYAPQHDALLLRGPTGCGKTSLVLEVAARLKWAVESVTVSAYSEVADLIGKPQMEQGRLSFQFGPLVRAMHYGEILLINEIDLMPSGVLAVLNEVLDGRALTINAASGIVIKPHAGFRVIATANSKELGGTSGYYQGVKQLNQAFLDHWRVVECDYPSIAQERAIIKQAYPLLNPDFVELILHFTQKLRNLDAGNRECQRDFLSEVQQFMEQKQQEDYTLYVENDGQEVDLAASDVWAGDATVAYANAVSRHAATSHAAMSSVATSHAATNNAFAGSTFASQAADCHYPNPLASLKALRSANEAGFNLQGPSYSSLMQLLKEQRQASASFMPASEEGVGEIGAAYQLSAPFSSRALLRICQIYAEHPDLSVAEAIARGYASRLPFNEYELVLRISLDIFGYEGYFDYLPHQITDYQYYVKVRACICALYPEGLFDSVVGWDRAYAAACSASAPEEATAS